ncbi:MerR family transcriptional regulator [Kineococcus sp. SYSU DK006]|uniref:MerR family transcriptional regulator n=1 Tax=Kineococcus sp. SYSU DK006 TaxID=3383127 RepID=UPI003D7DCDB8
MTELMSIGVFSRATRLSVRTLRNYDRLGLLTPAHIDPNTGYRRYAVDQFPQAGLIRRLRELEVGLPEITEILTAGSSTKVQAALERHRDRVVLRAAELEQIAARLQAVLQDPLQVPGWLHVYERRREAQCTARMLVHTSMSGLAGALNSGFDQLFSVLAEQGITSVGPPGARYPSDDLDAAALSVELFVPVTRAPRPAAAVEAGHLTRCTLAATIHEGSYDDVETAYQSLGRWITDHDRALEGPAEELYLLPPGPGVPMGAYRTEIAWPISSPPLTGHEDQ